MDETHLRKKAPHLKPVAWVGKKGLTPTVLGEIDSLLSAHHLIKIKILKSGIGEGSREDVIKTIVEQTGAQVIQEIGLVVVLYRA